MNILLDTHILLWVLTGSDKLPQKAIDIISDGNNEIYYSIASVWEVEIKNSIGKMPISGEELVDYCRQAGFKLLEIKELHVFRLKTLNRDETAPKHNDPFDRIMLAQAKTENYKFITHDTLISQYNEPCIIWL
jgi:PIN domain nuclease of toxin-antitoxin system